MLYSVGSFYILVALVLGTLTIVTTKKLSLLHKENVIVDNLYTVLGQTLTLVNYVLFIPSLTIFAEILRCDSTFDPSLY